MKALWRVIAVAVAVASAAPALAQENAQQPATQNAVVGPPQLQDFSINGTVTRRVEEEPAAQPPRQDPQRPAQQQQQQPAPTRRTEATEPGPAPSPQREAEPQISDPVSDFPLAPVGTEPPADLPAEPAAVPPLGEPSESGLSFLPWVAAGLLLAGASAWFLLRGRRRAVHSAAGHPAALEVGAPEPALEPEPAPPPKPAPAPEPSGAVVSTNLRPWLHIQFKPLRGVVDEQKAAIAFEVTVINSGTTPARDVLLEASLFCAGPAQDQQIKLFFDNPVAKGDRIPAIGPMQQIVVETAVFLARDQVKPIEMDGRSLLVPMVAFNALYSWGSGNRGQTSSSYLVGRQTKGEKLAPFRLDMGPRIFRNLDARTHELEVRA